MNDKYIDIAGSVKFIKIELGLDISKEVLRAKIYKMSLSGSCDDKFVEMDGKFYLCREFLSRCISKYKNSMLFDNAIEEIHQKYGFARRTIEKNLRVLCELYGIELINCTQSFVSIASISKICCDIERFKKENRTVDELISELNIAIPFVNFNRKTPEVKAFFSNEEYVQKLDTSNTPFIGKQEAYYAKDTTGKLVEVIKERLNGKFVSLSNITFEEFESLSKDEIVSNYYTLSEIKSFFIELGIENIDLYLNETFFNKRFDNKVQIIHYKRSEWFFNKEQVNKALNLAREYVPKEVMIRDNNLNNGATRRKKLEARGLKYEKFIPFYGTGTFVKKEDVQSYVEIDKLNDASKDAKTMIQKLKLRIEYDKNSKEKKFPLTMEIFYKFALKNSNNYKDTSPNIMHEFYNMLLNGINKEITIMSDAELNEMFNNLISQYGDRTLLKRAIISFNAYLRTDCKYSGINVIVDVSERNETLPYTKEEFINLVIKLVDIFTDEELMKQTYRNWRVSSALGHVFMHLCLCWRKNDIATMIPKPNLRLIEGIKNGEDFLRWIEDGNKLSHIQAKEICDDIEEKVNRLGLRTEKTSKQLICIIPEEMVNEVALILCINEANRQLNIDNHLVGDIENLFLKTYTESRELNRIFEESFNLNFREILNDNFKSTRMNKGFASLVREKTEELGMSYGYYFAQNLRSHSSKADRLSNTTKIYLNKDISDMAIKTFALGTMGSVVYNLASLLDKTFDAKNMENQIEFTKSLSLTPYSVEVATKAITQKSIAMESVISNYLKNGGSKENFLTELLYGQDSYGIERQTKCLLKVVKNADGNLESIELNKNKPCGYGKGSCIGCKYLIALRYFLYQFEPKFNKLLDNLEHSPSQVDLEINIERLNQLYNPVLQDVYTVLGDSVYEVLDLNRMRNIVNKLERGNYEYSSLQ